MIKKKKKSAPTHIVYSLEASQHRMLAMEQIIKIIYSKLLVL